MRLCIVLFVCLLIYPFVASANGGDVPVDSARGNYEGADNIHWYMQETLDYELWASDPPLMPAPTICNANDRSVSCSGSNLSQPLTLRKSNGLAPIAVKLEVDDRIDFGWRYALKQIRDTNRFFADSGVQARLFVSEISSVNVSNLYGDNIEEALSRNTDQKFEKTASNSADLIVVMFSKDSFGAHSDFDFPETCGLSTQGSGPAIQVVVSACEDSVSFAHQIGHTLGLSHEVESGSTQVPFDTVGVGFIDSQTGIGTLMSTSENRLGLLSSPNLQISGNDPAPTALPDGTFITLGSDVSNSVDAANSFVWTLALSNEATHDPSFDYEAEVYWDNGGNSFVSVQPECISNCGEPSVSLFTEGFLGDRELSLPYSSTTTLSANVLGPSEVTIEEYALEVVGSSVTITNVSATSSSTGIPANFRGLREGQVINAGERLSFSTVAGFTGGRTITLRFEFRIKETGQTFRATYTYQSN